MKVFTVLFLVPSLAYAGRREEFREALAKFGPENGLLQSEPVQVVNQRFRHFVETANEVDRINNDHSIPFEAEINFLSILTDEEVKQHLGFNASAATPVSDSDREVMEERADVKTASMRDFRRTLPDMKNQGICGSCWTFGAASALEGAIFMETGKVVAVSEQEYLDCADKPRDGCMGGWMSWCYSYSMRTGRIGYADDIKYTATSSSSRCKGYSKRKNIFKDYGLTLTKDERFGSISNAAMMIKASESVISVGVAVISGFQSYKSGVYVDPECRGVDMNHAITVVGYGQQGGRKYWLARNSWGSYWGDKGYIKMDRDTENFCGITTVPHRPALSCKGSKCKKQDPSDFNGGGDDEEEEEDDGEKECWTEVTSGKILKGKLSEHKTLEKAKSECSGDSECVGVYKKGKKYFEARTDKEISSKAKNFYIIKCCPSGTTKCPDGECRHEHMC